MSRSLALTPDQQSGKAAFKALVKSFGGQDAASSETGVRRQKISDMGLPNVAEFPTLDLIDDLEDRTVDMPGWPHVTHWLCRRRGGVFVPLPQGDDDADGMMRTVAEMAAEFGDVSRAVADAVCPHGPDGEEVNEREARFALDALDDLDRVSAQLRLKLSNKLKGGQS
ncbi:hypothetical protein SAMN02927924_02794 [Sphingobium faniae]|nr:hypothetical protein SAMN02927924_02794 [Sphingobium faniae]